MIYAIDSHVYMSFLKTSKAQQAGGYQSGPKVREKALLSEPVRALGERGPSRSGGQKLEVLHHPARCADGGVGSGGNRPATEEAPFVVPDAQGGKPAGATGPLGVLGPVVHRLLEVQGLAVRALQPREEVSREAQRV